MCAQRLLLCSIPCALLQYGCLRSGLEAWDAAYPADVATRDATSSDVGIDDRAVAPADSSAVDRLDGSIDDLPVPADTAVHPDMAAAERAQRDVLADLPAPDQHAPDQHAPDQHAPDQHAPDTASPPDTSPRDLSVAADAPAADAGQPSLVSMLRVGSDHSCALLDQGDLKCWGRNDFGQLGLGDREHRGDDLGEMGAALPAVDLGAAPATADLQVGGDHSCLSDTMACWCWGRNDHGQLGRGDREHRGDDPGEMGQGLVGVHLGTPPYWYPVAVRLGTAHTCVLYSSYFIDCWGHGGFGQLGRGTTDDLLEPGNISIGLGTSVSVARLYGGGDQTCIKAGVVVGGISKCFGRNDLGQLGLGDRDHRGDDPDEMGDALPAVELGVEPDALDGIYIGSGHSCALLASGVLKCWGDNSHGQLGLGDTMGRGDDPGEMGAALQAVVLGHTSALADMALGGSHTCARFEDGQVKCWGDNSSGQLGLGDTVDRGDAPERAVASLPLVDLGFGLSAARIAAGRAHTCALLDDGTVKCWGDNSFGQLGRGDVQSRGDDPGEMGDALPALDLGR